MLHAKPHSVQQLCSGHLLVLGDTPAAVIRRNSVAPAEVLPEGSDAWPPTAAAAASSILGDKRPDPWPPRLVGALLDAANMEHAQALWLKHPNVGIPLQTRSLISFLVTNAYYWKVLGNYSPLVLVVILRAHN